MFYVFGRVYGYFFVIFWGGGLHWLCLPSPLRFSRFLGHTPEKSRTVVQNFFSQCNQGLTRHFLFYEVRFVLLFFRTLLK